MNRRAFLIGILALIALLSTGAVLLQRQTLTELRSRQQRLVSLSAARASSYSNAPAAAGPDSSGPRARPSPELLELRNKVTRLMGRQRELAGVRAENDHLQAELARHGTNTSAALPPDYIRTSQAQWAGLNTPENTLQSFLWTLRNHDLTNLFRVLTPESAQLVRRRMSSSPDEFFRSTSTLPGLRIVSQKPQADGSLQLRVEVLPGQEIPGPLVLRSINGQWRLDLRH